MLFSTRIIGRVAKDAELKDAGTHKVCKFSVATSPQKDKTVWVNVTTWDKKAEVDAKYVKKGMMVYCEGTLQFDENGKPRTYQSNGETKVAGFELTGNTVLYLSKVSVEGSSDATKIDLDALGLSAPGEEIPF